MQTTIKPIKTTNLFEQDCVLRTYLNGYLSQGHKDKSFLSLFEVGELASKIRQISSEISSCSPPKHVAFDSNGHRIDLISLDHHQRKINRIVNLARLTNTVYDDMYKPHGRLIQACKALMLARKAPAGFLQSAMNDIAVRLMLDSAPNSMIDTLVPKFLNVHESASCALWQPAYTSNNLETKQIQARFASINSANEEEFYLDKKLLCVPTVDTRYALVWGHMVEKEAKHIHFKSNLAIFLLDSKSNKKVDSNKVAIMQLRNLPGIEGVAFGDVSLNGAKATLLCAGEIAENLQLTNDNIMCFHGCLQAAAIMCDNSEELSEFIQTNTNNNLQNQQNKKDLLHIHAQTSAAVGLCMRLAHLLDKYENGEASNEQKDLMFLLMPIAKVVLSLQLAKHCVDTISKLGLGRWITSTSCNIKLALAGTLQFLYKNNTAIISEFMNDTNKELIVNGQAYLSRMASDLPTIDKPCVFVREMVEKFGQTLIKRLQMGFHFDYHSSLKLFTNIINCFQCLDLIRAREHSAIDDFDASKRLEYFVRHCFMDIV